MATLQLATTTNSAEIEPDSVEDVRELIDRYFLGAGNMGAIEARISEPDHDVVPNDPVTLRISGWGEFAPVDMEKLRSDVEDKYPDREEGEIQSFVSDLKWDRQGEDARQFLGELGEYLVEPLVIQTVGYEKLRFPLIGHQWTVWPDGSIRRDILDSNPDKPDEQIQLSDAGRYTNIIAEDEMVASYDEQTGEFCVYDPHSLSEDPEYIVDVRGDDE